MTPRILAFAGSLRRDSFNKKLLPIAVKGARDAGAELATSSSVAYPVDMRPRSSIRSITVYRCWTGCTKSTQRAKRPRCWNGWPS